MLSAISGATPPLRSLKKRASNMVRTPSGMPTWAFVHHGDTGLRNYEVGSEKFAQIYVQLSIFALRSLGQSPHREAEINKRAANHSAPERNWHPAGRNLMISGVGFSCRSLSRSVEEAYSPYVHGIHERKDA